MKTYDEVRQILSLIEPSEDMYAKLDGDDIPLLQRLVLDPEAWLAARAVHAAARLGTAAGHSLISNAASDPRRELRAAAASVAPKLPADVSNTILERLIEDRDMSIKKLAITSIGPAASATLMGKLQAESSQGENATIKALAVTQLGSMR
jgi:hypothetical protein